MTIPCYPSELFGKPSCSAFKVTQLWGTLLSNSFKLYETPRSSTEFNLNSSKNTPFLTVQASSSKRKSTTKGRRAYAHPGMIKRMQFTFRVGIVSPAPVALSEFGTGPQIMFGLLAILGAGQ
ncbi:hypothetical protein M405DRAFT_877728 [Rhizopogon salebrosus TDB-379]|nr:hypothetical protein M405DRAFT_877728 [Rhizopogon salebrosus TDB-379]